MGMNQYFVGRQGDYESSARSYPRKFPLAVAKAKGAVIEDVENNRYIDFLNGAGSLALGHNNDEINSAMIELIDSGAPLHMLDIATPAKDRFVENLLTIIP